MFGERGDVLEDTVLAVGGLWLLGDINCNSSQIVQQRAAQRTRDKQSSENGISFLFIGQFLAENKLLFKINRDLHSLVVDTDSQHEAQPLNNSGSSDLVSQLFAIIQMWSRWGGRFWWGSSLWFSFWTPTSLGCCRQVIRPTTSLSCFLNAACWCPYSC